MKKQKLRKFLADVEGVDFALIDRIVADDVTTRKELVDRLVEVSRKDLIEKVIKSGLI